MRPQIQLFSSSPAGSAQGRRGIATIHNQLHILQSSLKRRQPSKPSESHQLVHALSHLHESKRRCAPKLIAPQRDRYIVKSYFRPKVSVKPKSCSPIHFARSQEVSTTRQFALSHAGAFFTSCLVGDANSFRPNPLRSVAKLP
jgi:hypothetical protein